MRPIAQAGNPNLFELRRYLRKERKILWTCLSIAILGIVVFFAFRFYKANFLDPKTGSQLQGSADSLLSEKTKRIYQSSRTPILPKKEDHIPQVCADYFSAVRGIDLKVLKIYPPKSVPIPRPDQCKDLPKSLVELNKHYLEACAVLTKSSEELTEKIWFASVPPCATAVFHFRAELTQFLTREMSIEDLEDPKILLDKMMATMSDKDYRTNLAVASRLLELEPSLVPAIQSQVLSRLMLAQTEARGNPNDPKWTEVEQGLQKLAELGGANSKQVLEWQLLISISRNPDPEEVRRYAERMAAQYPEWGLPYYYQAWMLYPKDSTGAKKMLEQAHQKDPEDLRIKETMEKMNRKDPSPFRNDFTVSFPKEIFE